MATAKKSKPMKSAMPSEGEVWRAPQMLVRVLSPISTTAILRPGARIDATTKKATGDESGSETRTVLAVVQIPGRHRRIIYSSIIEAPSMARANTHIRMCTTAGWAKWLRGDDRRGRGKATRAAPSTIAAAEKALRAA